METRIDDLAQKLFTEAGYQGNVYKAEPELLRRFENQSLEVLKGILEG